MSTEKILNLIAEAGLLKRVKRSGWWMLGMPFEESVADHSFRCAMIGYILAKMEGADTSKVLLMTLSGDLHESRINDLHKVAHKYLDVKKAEAKVFREQIRDLPPAIRKELGETREDYEKQLSTESVIARDADILECLIQAKEYHDLGYAGADRFFRKGPKHLKTKSALKLWKKALKWDSRIWWESLTVFER